MEKEYSKPREFKPEILSKELIDFGKKVIEVGKIWRTAPKDRETFQWRWNEEFMSFAITMAARSNCVKKVGAVAVALPHGIIDVAYSGARQLAKPEMDSEHFECPEDTELRCYTDENSVGDYMVECHEVYNKHGDTKLRIHPGYYGATCATGNVDFRLQNGIYLRLKDKSVDIYYACYDEKVKNFVKWVPCHTTLFRIIKSKKVKRIFILEPTDTGEFEMVCYTPEKLFKQVADQIKDRINPDQTLATMESEW